MKIIECAKCKQKFTQKENEQYCDHCILRYTICYEQHNCECCGDPNVLADKYNGKIYCVICLMVETCLIMLKSRTKTKSLEWIVKQIEFNNDKLKRDTNERL